MKNAKISLKFLVFTLILGSFTYAYAEGLTTNETLKCSGTEPFWGLTVDLSGEGTERVATRAQFSIFGSQVSPAVYGPMDLIIEPSENNPSTFVVGVKDAKFLAIIERKTFAGSLCNDGMSDLLYPYSVQMLADGKLYSGCCQSNIYPTKKEN